MSGTHHDPTTAAAAWLDRSLAGGTLPPLLIVIGLGEGYLLDVLEQVSASTRVLALEPDPEVARRFRARRDWSHWHNSGRLSYFVGPDYTGSDQAWRLFPRAAGDYKLVVDPALQASGGSAAAAVACLVKQLIFSAKANATARRRFAPRYVANSLANLPAITRGSNVTALADSYRGVPALIVGAGPSLDGLLPDLPWAAERSLLIATDTALRPLLHAGVHPMLTVGVDPGANNARHFDALPDRPRTWLVAESGLDPGAVGAFDDRTFWFRLANHDPWPWFRSLGIDVGHLAIWGSVLTAAFQTAVLAGCDPIVLVGADLAFTGGRPYARGTTHEFDWAYSVAIGDPLERAWQTQMSTCDRAVVADLDGRHVETTEPLVAFRDWMVRHAAASGRQVVNATGAGILCGDGIEQRSLTDVLGEPVAMRLPGDLERHPPTRRSSSELAAECRNVANRRDADIDLIERWRAFTAGALEVGAVASALERVAAALAAKRAAAFPSHGPQSVTSDGTHQMLRRLPETIGELRQTLNGASATAPQTSDSQRGRVDPRAALVQALELLVTLAHEWAALDEESVTVPASEARGRAPASGLRPWPSRARWPLLMVEALVHDARQSGPVPLGDHFFSRSLTPRAPGPDVPGSGMITSRTEVSGILVGLCRSWLRCASACADLDQVTATRFARLGVGLDRAARAEGEGRHDGLDARLVLVDSGGRLSRLPVAVDGRLLARAFTGVAVAVEDGVMVPEHVARDDAPANVTPILVTAIGTSRPGPTIGVEWTDASGPWMVSPERLARPLAVAPRVLTDEGAARSASVFSTPRGAACASLHGPDSYLIAEDGTLHPYQSWPKPVLGHFPMEDGGVVAWGHGATDWPHVDAGYAMSRAGAQSDVVVEPLSFRPTAGTWWNGRLYWSCLETGLGSWAPGQESSSLLSELSLVAVLPDDDGLVLQPCTRDEAGLVLRRRHTRGWHWAGDGDVRSVPLGRWGVTSCRSIAQGWTASAHPEADLVALTSDRGPVALLACFSPFALAWAGRSLVVCTSDGEVLFFDHLADRLDEWLATGLVPATAALAT